MLARLHVLLPYSLFLPQNETYPIYSYQDDGYEIRIFPPVKSDQPFLGIDAGELTINGKPSLQANALRVDFVKDSFDRQIGTVCDPPYELIKQTINSFLRKLRFVTRGFQIKEVNFPHVSWHLQYLNDDETELEATQGLVRGRGVQKLRFSWIALTSEIWNDIHSLPDNYSPPEWNSLYLDALGTLPDIGPSIVLAATSLEVFISYLLDMLAEKTTIPPDLWQWINNREWLREPTLAEQYDDLLHILMGLSLKDNPTLWEAFKNIKNARNSFVHEGIAKIGGKPITDDEAKRLVHQVAEIINFIKTKLPDEMQWTEFQHTVKVEIAMKLLGDDKKSNGT